MKTKKKIKRTFDRVPSTDPRNAAYPWRNKKTDKTSRNWNTRTFFRQGADPMCVAWATLNRLACKPISLREDDHVGARGIYHFAQTFDEWDGTDYDGTSVLGVVKFLQHFDIFSEYRWPDSAKKIANAVITTAPVIIGVDMYDGMAWPDSRNRMHIDGDLLGGHAMLIDGANTKTGLLRIKTWDETFGDNGHAWIDFESMDQLLSSDGEACVTIPAKGIGK